MVTNDSGNADESDANRHIVTAGYAHDHQLDVTGAAETTVRSGLAPETAGSGRSGDPWAKVALVQDHRPMGHEPTDADFGTHAGIRRR